MNSRNAKTLLRIRATPTPMDVRWIDLVSLIRALGGTIKNGRGSRRRILVKGKGMSLHEPHDGTLKAYQVEDVKRFLEDLGEVG